MDNNGFTNDSLLDIYIYETAQNIERLEAIILSDEKTSSFDVDSVNEIFRIMHTIKGSSAMMMYDNIASLAHALEDLFYAIRERQLTDIDYPQLSDLVLEGVDFIKVELEKVKNSDHLDGNPNSLIVNINRLLSENKDQTGPRIDEEQEEALPDQQNSLAARTGEEHPNQRRYEAVVFFEENCAMENLRAFSIIHNLEGLAGDIYYFPEDIDENNDSSRVIREQGFRIVFRSDKSLRELHEFFAGAMFVRSLEITDLQDGRISAGQASMETATSEVSNLTSRLQEDGGKTENRGAHQNIISVDVIKLDKLMDLMGEMVIAEAMVTQNPELMNIKLNSFYKAARQLRKITGEMQDMVMSIRMVPLTATFHKMQRVVRDMARKLDKDVKLELVGEYTEVDKNIIEHISDPLMHLVRNAVDHGIESCEERIAAGKPKAGIVTLEAQNVGSDVIMTVRDDGKGLNTAKIFKKASERGLLSKPQNEMSDKEIYNLIFLPGFSTNESVTEFSGRGVGMDVVIKNLESIGGSVSVESTEGEGTLVTMKIPLTLAIVDGMNIRVGSAKYTLPTTSIRETFKAKDKDLIRDPEGNEMIMIRGECYPILRIHKEFTIKTDTVDLTKGIMLMIEQDDKCLCLFADELLGQHQVVVKALPAYLKNFRKVEGLAGCTLLGDGSISLILNIGGLISMRYGCS
jgi:two-component system chemotaxis sensor kinase CheA